MDKIGLILREFGWVLIMGLVGVGVLVYGLWGVLGGERATVEIVKSGESSNIENSNIVISEDREILVDVAGEVEKPGVYKLPGGSRIGDALVMAGGLSEFADRVWVAATLNLASEVKDGGKIFIPKRDENSNIGNSNLVLSEGQKSGKVNINTASVAELDSLSGIGEVRAAAIIANRPYGSTEEIVEKAKVPRSVYESIKDQLTIY